GIPNGPADIATFGLSNTTDVSISEDTEVNSIIFTPAATNPYTITEAISCCSGFTLTLSGAGIINNSGITQTFIVAPIEEVGGQMVFTNSASAGNVRINLKVDGSINFFNRSTASSANIFASRFNNSVNFFNNSTAG